MLHWFTHYIYRGGHESCVDSWTLFTQLSILPSFIKLFLMKLEVQLLKRLLGHEPCPKPTLRPYTDKKVPACLMLVSGFAKI